MGHTIGPTHRRASTACSTVVFNGLGSATLLLLLWVCSLAQARPFVHPTTPSSPAHAGQLDTAPGNFTYYYAFAGIFVIILGACLWTAHARRRARKLSQMNSARQDTLALDIDGMPYPANRQPLSAARRRELGILAMRRDEGLDELGEAPPPYKPGARNAEGTSTGESAGDVIAIPLRTFHPDEPLPKLPEYYENDQPGHEDTHTPTSPDQGSPDQGSSEQVNSAPSAPSHPS